MSAGSRADAALALRAPQHDEVVLIGTGTEVSLCVEAAEALAKDGINVRVVSMPCWELFAQQPLAYQHAVLGDENVLKVACEAALGFGWERWIGRHGIFIGMDGFGASAPAPELYEHFCITAHAMVDAVKAKISL